MDLSHIKIAVVGLGYVGLPLAIDFSNKYKVIGFDISQTRVDQLNKGFDKTLELEQKLLLDALTNNSLIFTSDLKNLEDVNFYVVTVPTPVNKQNQPDLSALQQASRYIGKYLKKGDVVVFESTVFPGATEEICVPILQEVSNLEFNKDFFCGYSPERINPGDKEHGLRQNIKITSGSNETSADLIDQVYSSIVEAGTFKVSSIIVAEAAKIIENTQRDLNIALINELAILFNKMDIPIYEVLDAAGTKWNFQKFRPGLVGGHCIGVDPYYLTYKAQSIGYEPEIILSGRKINDGMSDYVVKRLLKSFLKHHLDISKIKVLVLGLTFKENCPDTRNSKLFNVIDELVNLDIDVSVFDPIAEKENLDLSSEVKILDSLPKINFSDFDAIVIGVNHDEFSNLQLKNKNTKVIFDITGKNSQMTEHL